MQRRTVLATAVAATLTAPAAASAHVTVQPSEAAGGGYTVLNVRVPNEQDDSGTRKVAVQMPDGFVSASYERVPGWRVRVTREAAPAPIEVHGEAVDDQVATVTFTSGGEADDIAPGQFQDFPLSVRVPEGATGSKLTFKAVQTYRNGDVVRWIGAPDADEPAPQLTLAAAAGEHGAAAAETTQAAAPPAAADGGGNEGLAIAALVVGGLGLLAGLGGLALARRARARPSTA